MEHAALLYNGQCWRPGSLQGACDLGFWRAKEVLGETGANATRWGNSDD